MADDQLQKLLQGALKAAKNGEKDLARRAFLQVIKRQPENQTAWFGMVTVGQDRSEQRTALKRLLQLNPTHKQGLAAAQRMGYDPATLIAEATTTADAPADAPEASQPQIQRRPKPEDAQAPTDDFGDQADNTFGADFATQDDRTFGNAFATDDAEVQAAPFGADATFDDVDSFDAPGLFDADSDASSNVSPFDEDSAFETPEADDAEASKPAFADISLEDVSPEELESLQKLVDAPAAPSLEVDLLAEFAKLPPPPDGLNNIPTPDFTRLQPVKNEADERAQDYIERLRRDETGIVWEKKRNQRAGEREILVLRFQQAAVAAFVLVVLVGFGGQLILTQPAVQRALFAPTWTVSPTPTVTPTATPGITPTPSPVPRISLTPSPEFPATVTPGNPNPNLTPTATNVYLLGRFGGDVAIQRALALMEGGSQQDLQMAFDLLEQARFGTEQTGNFLPYYYLSLWHLEQNDLVSARQSVVQGEQAWRERSGNEEFIPAIDTAYARVELAEGSNLLNQPGAAANSAIEDFLDSAQERLESALALDARFVDAHLLLAERYQMVAEYTEALGVLRSAQNSRVSEGIFTDERLRLAEAEIYFELGQYEDALQELNELLYINPHQQSALRLRTETVLAQNRPGLGVIYAEEYLFYHPDSLQARKLLGDARVLENKPNEGLREYTTGIETGASDAPAYVDLLLARANVYERQRRYQLAQLDLDRAMTLTNNSRDDIRVQRMLTAYAAGNYSIANADAQRLLNENGAGAISVAALNLLQARILVDQARTGQQSVYNEALGLLNSSLAGDLSAEERATANEYAARAHFNLGNYGDALNAVNRALTQAETGSRYYLRAQIHEQQGNFAAALADYEFVLSWSQVFPFAFRVEAEARYNAVSRVVARSA